MGLTVRQFLAYIIKDIIITCGTRLKVDAAGKVVPLLPLRPLVDETLPLTTGAAFASYPFFEPLRFPRPRLTVESQPFEPLESSSASLKLISTNFLPRLRLMGPKNEYSGDLNSKLQWGLEFGMCSEFR